MRYARTVCTLGALFIGGCVVAPEQRVVERDYYTTSDGQVTQETIVVDDPPPAYVEVVPARPYYGAVWIGGGWGYRGGYRYYHRGHWR